MVGMVGVSDLSNKPKVLVLKNQKLKTLSVLFKSCLQSVALIFYLKAHMLACFAILIFSPICVCCVECSRTQPHILDFF